MNMTSFEARRKVGKYDGVAMNFSVSAPDLVGWVGIYRCVLNFRYPDGNVEREPGAVSLINGFNLNVPEACEVLWRIRLFEIDADYDETYWLSEADLKNQRDLFAFSEDDVTALILRLGLDPTQLRNMGETAYPI